MPLFVDHAGTNTLVSQDLDTENNILSIHDRQSGSRSIYVPPTETTNPILSEFYSFPNSGPMSFSFWVNLDQASAERVAIQLKQSAVSNKIQISFAGNQVLKFEASDSSGNYFIDYFNLGSDFTGSWNHIWLGWSGDWSEDPVLYVNGQVLGRYYRDSSATFPSGDFVSVYLVSLFDSSQFDGGINELGGKMQAVGIWTSNNTSDVPILYNDGLVNTVNIPSEDDILDFWLLGDEKELEPFSIGDSVFQTGIRSIKNRKTTLRFPGTTNGGQIAEGAPIESTSNNFLGDVTGAKRLAALNTHRNGPYGFSTWNQLRVSQNPLSRYHRKVNTLTFVTEPGIQRNIGGSESLIVRDRYSRLYNYTEPCVTERHYPVVWNVGRHFLNSRRTVATEPQKFSILSSFGNQLESFTNEDVSKLLNHPIDEEKSDYSEITKLYLDGGLESQDSPITYWEFLQYRESIYPKQINQYRGVVRDRPQYESFYNESRLERTERSFTSSLGFEPKQDRTEKVLFGQSKWPLDEDQYFLTRNFASDSTAVEWSDNTPDYDVDTEDGTRTGAFAGRYGQGFLMMDTSQYINALYFYGDTIGDGTITSTIKDVLNTTMHYGPLYTRRVSMEATQSVSSPSGMLIPETASSTNSNMPRFQGGALWEAGSTRQVKTGRNTYVTSEKKPFYNTYSDYAQEIQNKGKNYSVVPEFRMSIQFEDLLDAPDLFEQDIFEITGGISGSEDSSKNSFYETYSNSEFMKNFEIVQSDHEDFTSATILSLRCKAIKKFLPYDGFYPAQRTAQLAEKFINDTNGFITVQNDSGESFDDIDLLKQSAYVPLFAPGIMFNTIKSGIAVDFPVLTSSMTVEESSDQGSLNNYFINNDGFDVRVPFEAIIDPKSYIKDIAIQSMEPSPYGNMSSSAQWRGDGSEIYSYMANNFMAEVPSFFLQGGNMSSLVSKKQSAIGVLEDGKVYGMRIKMRRSMSGKRNQVYKDGSESTPYFVPQDIIRTGSNDVRETFTMYSRPSAFGPPSFGKTTWQSTDVEDFFFDEDRQTWDSVHKTLYKDSFNGYNYPFTPPYYHGESWCDIIITGSGDQLTLATLQATASYTYTRFDYTHIQSTGHTIQSSEGPQAVDNLNDNAMQLNASVVVDGLGRVAKRGRQGGVASGQIIVDSGVNEDSRWIIQPKLETPMLNFNHISEDGGTLSVPVYGSESVPRGIWHQYGRIPEQREGVFLEVGPIPKSWETQVLERGPVDPLRDLSEFLGFNGASTKLGKIAKQKTISEAVVAVPFVQDKGRRKFFRIDKDKVQKYKNGELQLITTGPASNQIGRSVLDQLDKMRKFVFPPSMDFLNYDTVEPFAMYIFEFEHTLTQQDLADIWQNLPPDIGETMEVSEVAITHPLLQKEILGKGGANGNVTMGMPEKLRWMVFKVKQRAAANYFKKVVKSNVELNSDVASSNSDADEFGASSNLQFNWPYDYFSLVEMVKIDAEIELGNADLSNYTDTIPSWNAVEASPKAVQDILRPIQDAVPQHPVTNMSEGETTISSLGLEEPNEEVEMMQKELEEEAYNNETPQPQSNQGNEEQQEQQQDLEDAIEEVIGSIEDKMDTSTLSSSPTAGGPAYMRNANFGGSDGTGNPYTTNTGAPDPDATQAVSPGNQNAFVPTNQGGNAPTEIGEGDGNDSPFGY